MKEIKFDIYDDSDKPSKLFVLEGNFNYKQQIKDILEEFDFERVEKAMKVLHWKYSTSDFKEYIPDIQELKKTAKECLERAVKFQSSENGGFLATNSGGVLNLYFVLEETMNDFYNLKNVKIYEKPLNKEKILKKIKRKFKSF